MSLDEFGKTVKNYFLNCYLENESFLLDINNSIFNDCLNKAHVSKEILEKQLRTNEYIYRNLDNINIQIAIAAFQVNKLFDSKTDSDDALLNSLLDFYQCDLNNLYKKYLTNQEKRWRKIQDYFKSQKRFLMLDNKAGKYITQTCLKYPKNQLFYIVNRFYRYELINICLLLNISSSSSINEIEEKLIQNKQWKHYCRGFMSFLNFGESVSDFNHRKLITQAIYSCITRELFVEEIKNIQKLHGRSPNHFDKTYDLIISFYKKHWYLNIFLNNEYSSELSENEDNSFEILQKEVFNNQKSFQLFFENSENEFDESEDKTYRMVVDSDDVEDIGNLLLLTTKKIPKFEGNLKKDYFLGKELFIYILDSVEQYQTVCKEDISEENKQSESIISKFKGGIKVGYAEWLLGCEPKVPESIKLEFDKLPRTYSVKYKDKSTVISVVDSKPLSQSKIQKENIGWKQFNLPNVCGLSIEIQEQNEVYSKAKLQYEAKREKKGKELKIAARGYFDNENLRITEIQQGINWECIDSDNLYIVSKDLLHELKILYKENLLPGYEYSFNLHIKSWLSLAFASHLEVIGVPYEEKTKCIIRKTPTGLQNEKILYKAFKQNKKMVSAFKAGKGIYINSNQEFSFSDVYANAVGFGANCVTVDMKNGITEQIKSTINLFNKLCLKNPEEYFMLILENCDTGSLKEDLGLSFTNSNFTVFVFLSKEIPSFKIMDENIYEKQRKLKIWLEYVGFAKWSEINRKCKEVISGEDETIITQYGKNPFYRLFNPLIINGDVEICKKIDSIEYYEFGESKKMDVETFGFCMSPSISIEDKRENGFDILKNFPNLKEYISHNWNCVSDLGYPEIIYKQELFGHLKYGEKFCSTLDSTPFIFKNIDNKSPHVPSYFVFLEGNEPKVYKVDSNQYDSINYAYCVSEVEKNVLFEYSRKQRQLTCKKKEYFYIIPVLIQRALQLFDYDNRSYLPYRNYQPFNNIDESVIIEIRRIFGENSVEEY